MSLIFSFIPLYIFFFFKHGKNCSGYPYSLLLLHFGGNRRLRHFSRSSSRKSRQSKELADDFYTKLHHQGQELVSILQSMINSIDDQLRTKSKEADESNRFAIETISDLMSGLRDQLGECISNEKQLIRISSTLETFQRDSKNMSSVWSITIQVFSSVGIIVICCTLGASIFIVYQRSLINKLLRKQINSSSNSMRLTSNAFDHVVNFTPDHSPPHSSTTLTPKEPKDSGLPDSSLSGGRE